MNELIIPGFKANRLASALASFGLYVVYPSSTLRFVEHNRRWVAAFSDPECPSLEALADKLSSRDLWKSLHINGDIGHITKDRPILGGLQFYRGDHDVLQILAPEFLAGFGTDTLIKEKKAKEKEKKKKDEPTWEDTIQEDQFERTPFYTFMAQARFDTFMQGMVDLVQTNSPLPTLQGQWQWSFKGQSFGLFPEYDAGKAFRQTVGNVPQSKGSRKKKKAKVDEDEDVKQVVPVLVLLACAAWRLFPVFSRSGRAMMPGYYDKKLYYPVFDRPLRREDFVSLMLNSQLQSFSRHRTGFHKLGIHNVYSCNRISGSKISTRFTPPVDL